MSVGAHQYCSVTLQDEVGKVFPYDINMIMVVHHSKCKQYKYSKFQTLSMNMLISQWCFFRGGKHKKLLLMPVNCLNDLLSCVTVLRFSLLKSDMDLIILVIVRKNYKD